METALEQLYDEIDYRQIRKMTPGIVAAIDQCEMNQFRADHIDSRARNNKIGSALSILQQTGHLKQIFPESDRIDVYERTDKKLGPAKKKAETLYIEKIAGKLKKTSGNVEDIVQELEQKEIPVTTKQGTETEIIPEYRDDYSEETLEFLSEADIIRTVESRELSSDDLDIEFMLLNLEECIEQAYH